ncbi:MULTISPECIES: response regulator transcription factor [unclassified Streptomyces]|uniref:response regulator transcription factor n=1 Tax=unclassified Streptomyces TaxID=2593676 RepID=UPI00116331B9|nr:MULTISPECIES: response regulator transcription factor [unclassified Streptomyces]QDN85342.1 response regulator transcription factor [Streptomyces sp. RLB3-6]QDO06191.1 response regulator transcription factor [Streptomyces sp. S1D4-23]
MTISVLLADDQALLRATFRILIDSCPDLEVVDEATNGKEAVDLARIHKPDIVLMDIRMPHTDGLTATATICADPDLDTTRVLILTTFEIDEYVAQALRAGASGFLGKDVGADALLDAIRTVAAGDTLLSPQATRTLITRFLTTLTAREREVMALAAEGHSNNEIADQLTVSPLTVRTHIHRAMTKLGARDRAQLVVIAYQTGLVTPAPPTP